MCNPVRRRSHLNRRSAKTSTVGILAQDVGKAAAKAPCIGSGRSKECRAVFPGEVLMPEFISLRLWDQPLPTGETTSIFEKHKSYWRSGLFPKPLTCYEIRTDTYILLALRQLADRRSGAWPYSWKREVRHVPPQQRPCRIGVLTYEDSRRAIRTFRC